MEFFYKVTRHDSRLADGSYEVKLCGQWEHFAFTCTSLLVPKPNCVYVLPKIDSHFMPLLHERHHQLESGYVFIPMPDPYGPVYYNIPSSRKPQHRILFDSSTFDPCGFIELSLRSSGKQQESSKILHRSSSLFSLDSTKILPILQSDHTGMKMSVQIDLYDLRPSQFGDATCRRAWVSERTMTRMMSRELEQMIGGRKAKYKGVRWRPERKHPWIAELRLPQKKKIWIGSFNTPEEAARAHDVAAIHHGKETSHNFDDSLHQVFKSRMLSSMCFGQRIQDNAVGVSTFYCAPLDTDDNTNKTQRSQTINMSTRHPSCSQYQGTTHVVNFNESYHMFANDLPIMVDKPVTIQRIGTSFQDPMLVSHEPPLLKSQGEDVASFETTTRPNEMLCPPIEDFGLANLFG